MKIKGRKKYNSKLEERGKERKKKD